MKKNCLFLLLALACMAGKSHAQVIDPCGSTQMDKKNKERYPQIEVYQKQLEQDISNFLSKKNISKFARTSSTNPDSVWYDLPIVVHIQHNYGAEVIPDYKIFNLIAQMNQFYALQNDTSSVVSEFKQYVGKAQMRFHLATKDPYGNPTKGITHRLTYLTYGGDDEVKMDQWPPSNYLNLWFEARVGAPCGTGCIVVAYAEQPATAAADPYIDGVISNYSFINDYETNPGATGGSIDHEFGHIFSLWHTFGMTNDPGPSHTDPATNYSGHCGDDDEVDDTPPTDGCLGCCNLYDTVCSQNYFKIYTDILGGDSLVNYPDTANEQNIMNYAECKVMFTKGQVERMHAALNSDVGKRDSLWSPTNLYNTGALVPTPDLAPVTDFTVFNTLGGTPAPLDYFTCPGVPVKFTDFSWGDTLTSISWTMNNGGASVPTLTSTATSSEISSGTGVSSSITTSFSKPGWVSMTLAATGNNSGTTTTTYPRAEFVADSIGTPASSYFQEFSGSDTARWPIFNYYTNQYQVNQFEWQFANVGYDDNNSIEYIGYDYTYNPTAGLFPIKGTPLGDYSDFFSIPIDFTGNTSGDFYLNYYYSGTSRSSNSVDINDTMLIQYSTNNAESWTTLATLAKESLDNMGALSTPYMPTQQSDWAPMSISIPTQARTKYTIFRFRYKPSVGEGVDGGLDIGNGSYSSGNNFYMDRINFNSIPASVNNVKMNNIDITLAPNPTNGDAYVVIKDAGNTTAEIIVSDITGKVVYKISQQLASYGTNIQIPHAAISVQGVYMVQAITGNQARTLKLVVY